MTNLLSDDELLQKQIEVMEEIRYGCYPIYEAMDTSCRLMLEWTARERARNPGSPQWCAWEKREESGRSVVELIDQCRVSVTTNDPEKAAHAAATAASIYFSVGHMAIIEEMKEAAEKRKKQLTDAGITSGEERQKERQPDWALWQKSADEIFNKNKNLSKWAVCLAVGKKHNVTARAIYSRVTNVGKTRTKKV